MTKAVLLITFNRLDYLKEVFAAMAKAEPPKLYISSDGPRENRAGEREAVFAVRKWLLDNISWQCEVKTRFLETNSGGCGPGVSGAVSWFFQNEKDGIVLEDDCVPSASFFRYCEEMLDRYADDKRVWHISGYAPVNDSNVSTTYYFAQYMHCWGWAGWADRWSHFNLHPSFTDDAYSHISRNRHVNKWWKSAMEGCASGRIETWDYQWAMIIISHHGLCACPTVSLIENIGAIGTHYSAKDGEGFKRIPANELVWPLRHPEQVKLEIEASEKVFRRWCCPKDTFLPVVVLKRILKFCLPSAFVEGLRKLRSRIDGSNGFMTKV